MPSIKWNHVCASPALTLKIIAVGSWLTIKAVVARPLVSSPLSLRNTIARAWVGAIFSNNPSILYSEPTGHQTQCIETPTFRVFSIPSVELSEMRRADAVVIFVHGGGIMIGHPLQYLTEYKRWVQVGRAKGKKIVFLALQYPLSPSMKWPAQRESLLALYNMVLCQSVSPSRIVFAGDSAGCDLIYLTLLHLRDHHPSRPLPSCVVAQSPWLDWTGSETMGSSNGRSDFMFHYDISCPVLNDALRPPGLPQDTPEISALLANDVGNLPPQLIFYSRDEILESDSIRWIDRSRAAGVEITTCVVSGEMHTFALGWPISGTTRQKECDEIMIEYIIGSTAIS